MPQRRVAELSGRGQIGPLPGEQSTDLGHNALAVGAKQHDAETISIQGFRLGDKLGQRSTGRVRLAMRSSGPGHERM